MPALGPTSIYVTDPAFIRAKLEAGETPFFIMNIDRNLRVNIQPQILDGVISCLVYAEFMTSEGMVTDEPVVFSLLNFVESDEGVVG